MNPQRPTPAKIIQHSMGLGTPSADLVRERAWEVAMINEHRQPTAEDWEQAKRELHGGNSPLVLNGDLEIEAVVSEHDMVRADTGHHVPRVFDDDDHVVEELIAEGMEEAVHDQMLASRKMERRQTK